MEKPIIAIYGAFDRFNFGDILFPIVVRHYAPKTLLEKGEWLYYGLIDSDLRDRGGFENLAISRLVHGNPMPAGSVIIVPGGEVITASINNLYKCFFTDIDQPDGTFRDLIRSKLGKKRGIVRRAMRRLGVPWKYPLVPVGDQIPGSPLTAFLGVGGRTLEKLPPDSQQQICSALSSAIYLSVRDPLTQSTLMDSGLSRCQLMPDPVHAIRRIYSVNKVRALASQATQLVIDSHQKKGYFCFQSALRHLNGQSDRVAAALDEIADQTGLMPVLIAAGTALLHEDDRALYSVSIKMKRPHVFVPMPSVMDVVALIACSKLGISTSLHAMIIAMSYGVPRLALSGLESKTSNYAKHWDPVHHIEDVDYSNMVSLSLRAIQSDPGQRNVLAETMAGQAERFIRDMWEVVWGSSQSQTQLGKTGKV